MEKAELPNKIKDNGEKHIENHRGFNILFSEEDLWHTNFVDRIGLFSNFYTSESLKSAIDDCLDNVSMWDK